MVKMSMSLLLHHLLLLLLLVASALAADHDCSEFKQEACVTIGNNLLDKMKSNSPLGCQEYCARTHSPCEYFSFDQIENSCSLFRNCTSTEYCAKCISGPYTPQLVVDCPIPPRPTTTTATTTTTTLYCNNFWAASCELGNNTLIDVKT